MKMSHYQAERQTSRPRPDPLYADPGGRERGAAHTQTDHSQGTHIAASHLTSHTRHDARLATDPKQTNPPTLTVPRAVGQPSGWVPVSVSCMVESVDRRGWNM